MESKLEKLSEIATRLRSRVVLLSLAGVVLFATVLLLRSSWLSQISEYVSGQSPVPLAIEYAQSLLLTLGYPGLVLVIFVENVFPPIPSDIVLPLAGYTAATTSMSLFGAMLATTTGSLLGALVLYYLGYWLGEHRVRRLSRRFGRYLTFEEDELDRSLAWFRRHGSAVVLVARLVPVFRSLISIPAGMSGMPLGRFLVFTAIGAGAWNSGLISTGYLLGSNWNLVTGWMEQYQFAMIAVSAVVFSIVVAVRVRTWRARSRGIPRLDVAIPEA